MADYVRNAGVLNVVPPAALEAQIKARNEARSAALVPQQPQVPELGGYIRTQHEIFRNHRNSASGWSERLLEAQRTFMGKYTQTKLNEITKFGGSQVYARLTAQKCRAASSLLRDIYLGPDRPWAIKPPADPDVPDEIVQKIDELMAHEQQMVLQTTGVPPNPEDAHKRREALLESAAEAAMKKARKQAGTSEDRIEEFLREGGFYHALAEFLVDLPIFPFACIKGPTVKIMPEIKWPPGGGRPTVIQVPKMVWTRVSPFDIWWTPGVSDIESANVIEKSRLTRSEINDLLDLPGYDQTAVRAVLDEYGRGGLYENWDTTDAERAVLESRENPAWNRSGLIAQLEFHGNVQGRILQEYGMPGIPDPLRDYRVDAYVIGNHVLKVNMAPSPRARHNYYITSFEKVPGTPLGNSLVDLIADLQEVANATLRSLVNNISIASGPQVVVNDDRVLPEENTDDLYPWKRWHTRNDPVGNNAKPPLEFYQPQSNAQELIAVFKAFVDLSDDVSAIPKYIGGQASGGAGRTSSGLAMLMANAAKILQTVSANIDRDVFEKALIQLADLVLLTDTTGLLTGEEDINVQGVSVAVQRETQRQRQLEFLQHTQNPIDMTIMGMKGRGAVLRSVSGTIGLDGDAIVPGEEELIKKQEQQEKHAQQQALSQRVDAGIQQGVQQGVSKISSELTAGLLASQAAVPGGPSGSAMSGLPGGGTPPGAPGGTPPGMEGPLAALAGQGQGNQPTVLSNAPAQGVDIAGNQRKPPGPGGRPLPIQGGPG
jgi:hypothetical protein